VKEINAETGSAKEYFYRLDKRLQRGKGVDERIIQITNIAASTETHLVKCDMSKRRYEQAVKNQDEISIAFEKNIMLALMYEIVDTSYIVMNLLNFNELDLDSSRDGSGLAGESAHDVVQVISALNDYCTKVLALETDLKLKVDFRQAVDEQMGLTYDLHPHWKNFFAGDYEISFYSYFARTQFFIEERMTQKPRFWTGQSVWQYLRRNGYHALLEMLARLEKYNFLGHEEELRGGRLTANE